MFSDESRRGEIVRFNMLRQQEAQADGRPNLSLADFVADRSAGVRDYVGAFAVTAGIGADELARQFERAQDDYSGDPRQGAGRSPGGGVGRVAPRHRAQGMGNRRARSSPDDVILERHRGIRPGFGYPACPDHSEKFKLFDLLEAPSVGVTLTDHAAMLPAASVSGLYFAHPQAKVLHGWADWRRPGGPVRTSQGPVDRVGRALALDVARVRVGAGWVGGAHTGLAVPASGGRTQPAGGRTFSPIQMTKGTL